MDKKYKIYSLKHPLTREIRYIGVTSCTLEQRYSQHKHTALKRKQDTHVAKWFRKVYSEGLLPLIELIEVCSKDTWQDREKYWIGVYNNLTNIREGGTGVIVDRSMESIQRSINAHKKPVVLLNKKFSLHKRFDSSVECAKFLGTTDTAINNFLKGRSKSVLGYIVLYEKDYIANTYIKEYNGVSKDIFQYDLDGNLIEKHLSITEAFNKVSPCKYASGIHEAIKRKGRCGEYFWATEEIIDFSEYKSNIRKGKTIINGNKRTITK